MKRIAILVALAFMLAGCGEYSLGVRTGTLQKFSHKGLISKTWEGEMLLGGLVKHTTATSDSAGQTSASTSMVANVFEFTVEDSVLADKIGKLLDSGGQVKLTYRQDYVVNPFRSETAMFFGAYFVIGAEAR